MEAFRKSQVERLRNRAELALSEARSRRTLEPLLRRIVELAEQGSDASLFAHRHMAELLIERHSWRAALHLRSLLQCRPHDSVAHALMGLCQALMGNFRVAVRSYQRALHHSPQNPWYLHNVGHLLDIALDRPRQALESLQEAHRLEPREHEITASLAHCLARLGRTAEALVLAKRLTQALPDHDSHRELLAWLRSQSGLCSASTGSSSTAPLADAARHLAGPASTLAADSVAEALMREMAARGFTAGERAHALQLWQDFRLIHRPRIIKPEVYAAAVEYAYSVVNRIVDAERPAGNCASKNPEAKSRKLGVSCSSLARRYGVTASSVQARYQTLQASLQLKAGDVRYCSKPDCDSPSRDKPSRDKPSRDKPSRDKPSRDTEKDPRSEIV